MDGVSEKMMSWFANKWLPDRELSIVDIGSRDINGNYRKCLTNTKWRYIGIDVVPGRNVDIVANKPYHYPIEDNQYDVVISGQTGEHVEDLYAWADEAIRILKPNGLMYISIPCSGPEHKHPIDCWRIYPDGMRWLFVTRTKKMQELWIDTYIPKFPDSEEFNHCYAVLRKL